MLDHAALLTRFVGYRVCVTLYGQNKVWGRVATVCHDSVRLTETAVVSELEDQEWANQSLYEDNDDSGRARYAETVIQLNHIVSITCLDEDVPPPEDELETPIRLENAPSRVEPSPRSRGALPRRTAESELTDTHIEAYAEHFLGQDRLAIELGYGLLQLIDPEDDVDFLARVDNLRKTLAAELGLWLPPVHIRDNLRIGQHDYRILVCGQEVARGVLQPDCWFSIDPDVSWDELPSEPQGVDAHWISREQVDDETLRGRVVVEASAVIVGRLHSVARAHAADLWSIDDVRRLIERARLVQPVLIDELQAHGLPLGVLRRVLSLLLAERVPVRGLVRILETLVSIHRLGMREPEELVGRVRQELARDLCSPFLNGHGHIPALLLDASLEQLLWRAVRGNRIVLPIASVQALCQVVADRFRTAGRRVPLIVDVGLRKPLRDLLSRAVPSLSVLACSEIPSQVGVIPAAILTSSELPAAAEEGPAWAALVAQPLVADAADPETSRFASPDRRPLREPVVRNA